MDTAGEIILGLFIVVLVIAAIIFSPLITIWALNTLFNLGIAYTFWTWLAALCLCGILYRPTWNMKSKS